MPFRRRSTDQPEHKRAIRGPRITAILTSALLVACMAVAGITIGNIDSLIHKVQGERARAIRYECVQTNYRNIAAKRQLDKVLRLAIQLHPRSRHRLEQSKASTVSLIDALVPVRNCDRVVSRSVKAATGIAGSE